MPTVTHRKQQLLCITFRKHLKTYYMVKHRNAIKQKERHKHQCEHGIQYTQYIKDIQYTVNTTQHVTNFSICAPETINKYILHIQIRSQHMITPSSVRSLTKQFQSHDLRESTISFPVPCYNSSTFNSVLLREFCA